MIEGFCDTIKADCGFIIQAINGKYELDEHLNVKIALVGIRALATISMGLLAIATLDCLKNIAKKSTIGFAAEVAVIVTTYVLAHDIFVIAQNTTRFMTSSWQQFTSTLRLNWNSSAGEMKYAIFEKTYLDFIWNPLCQYGIEQARQRSAQ